MSISNYGAFFAFAVMLSGPSPAQSQERFSRGDLEFFEAKVRPVLVKRCFSCRSTEAKKTHRRLALTDEQASWKAAITAQRRWRASRKRVDLSRRLVTRIPFLDAARRKVARPRKCRADRMGTSRSALSGNVKEAKTRRNQYRSGTQILVVPTAAPGATPTVKEKAWVGTKIDAFVLAELEKQRLTHSPRRRNGS